MKKKVLIVDDNSTNLYLLKSLLEGEGLEVIAAENGNEALEKAHADPPDLIVSDILMPVMDGYTFCRQCKADERLKKIPFAFYTATYTEPKDEKFALSLGADRFILKPQEPDMFMNILKELLEEKYAVKQVAAKPLGEDMEFFRQYNEVLFRKLEKKMLDLEIVNQKLKSSEEQYRLSFENVADIVYTIDTDLNFLSVSPSVERMLGYKPKDFIGRSVSVLGNILAPESMERAIANLSSLLKGETIPAMIYRCIAKDGTIKYLEISGSPLMHESEIIGIISVVRDITERKQAENNIKALLEAVQQEKTRLSSLIESITDEVWFADTQKRFTIANPSALKQFCIDDNQIIEVEKLAKSLVVLRPDGSVRPVEEAPPLRALSGEVVTNQEEIIKTPLSGEFRYRQVNAAPVRDSVGNIVGSVSVVRDITDRKRAEEAMRESEEKYRGILENMDDAYYELDLNGNLVFFNEALILKTGYSRGELMGMNYRQYMSPETCKHVLEVFSEIFRTGQFVRLFDYEIIMKDGQTRYFESWASLLSDNNNKPIGFKGMARDITARKRAEEMLIKTTERLRRLLDGTVQAISTTVETRDPYTAGHQRRSAELARSIASEMGLSADRKDFLHVVAAIHDIGKIAIPAEILSKPTKLTNIELSLIKIHPQAGHDILKDIEFPWPVADVVLQHHERMDGSGYPEGLKGEAILLEARIMAVADVVEAIASHRPYRAALGVEAAMEEISKNRGILYDPMVVEACLKLFHEKGYSLN